MRVRKPSRVADYLQHILDAIERAVAHISDVSDVTAFEVDTKSQDSVVRNIEIIGEAANKIVQADPAFVALHPEIPWQLMRAMRNKIIHDYFEVDYELVWRTVKNDLPLLVRRPINFDTFNNHRHSREGGNPVPQIQRRLVRGRKLDARLRGHDVSLFTCRTTSTTTQ